MRLLRWLLGLVVVVGVVECACGGTEVVRHGGTVLARDGREIGVIEFQSLPPIENLFGKYVGQEISIPYAKISEIWLLEKVAYTGRSIGKARVRLRDGRTFELEGARLGIRSTSAGFIGYSFHDPINEKVSHGVISTYDVAQIAFSKGVGPYKTCGPCKRYFPEDYLFCPYCKRDLTWGKRDHRTDPEPVGLGPVVPADGKLPKGPIVWWPLDEGKGAIVKDRCESGLHGRVNGAQWRRYRMPLRGDRPVLRFAKKGDHVVPPGTLGMFLRHYTVQLWLVRSGERAGYLISKGRLGTAVVENINFSLSIRADSRIDAVHEYGNNDSVRVTSYSAVGMDKACHVAVAYDGREMRIFVNGKLEATSQGPPPTGNKWPVVIGNVGQKDWAADCLISDVRIYGRARSAKEIAAEVQR